MRSHLIQSGINLFRACLMTCCFVWFSVFSGPVDLKDWFFFYFDLNLRNQIPGGSTHGSINGATLDVRQCICPLVALWKDIEKKCWCHDNKKLKLKLAIWKLADINAQRCKCWEKNVRGVPSDNQIDRIRC